jgi:hypothetical protein
MRCDSRVSLLAHNLASPCLGCEPKAKGYNIQPFNVIISTTCVEIVVTPNTNFVKGGVLIGLIMNLGYGLGKVSVGRNLNKSSILPTSTIGVVGTPRWCLLI